MEAIEILMQIHDKAKQTDSMSTLEATSRCTLELMGKFLIWVAASEYYQTSQGWGKLSSPQDFSTAQLIDLFLTQNE